MLSVCIIIAALLVTRVAWEPARDGSLIGAAVVVLGALTALVTVVVVVNDLVWNLNRVLGA